MIRILDWNYQTPRLFGEFFEKYKIQVDTQDNINGVYDLIIFHREGIQDVEFSEFEEYCHQDTKIICDITTESGNIQCFLDSYKKTTEDYDYKFYLIADTDLSKYHQRVPVKYTTLDSYCLSFYAFLNPAGDNQMTLETDFSSYENSFMSLNNSCRNHRVLLLSNLIKRKLDLSNCSFLMTTSSDMGYIFTEFLFKEAVIHLVNDGYITDEDVTSLLNFNLPKQLDVDFRSLGYISNKINHNIYKSILNLVTENLFGISHGDITEDKIVTFTEKVIKPFQARQIPLFIGLPNLQETLRKLGFDLFDDLINNSFEKETNHILRMDMILNELERLLTIDLHEFKQKNLDRFEKNYNLLLTLSNDGKELVEEFLLKHIFSIEKLK